MKARFPLRPLLVLLPFLCAVVYGQFGETMTLEEEMADCRVNAHAMRVKAQNAEDPDKKAIYLELAATYESLAGELRRMGAAEDQGLPADATEYLKQKQKLQTLKKQLESGSAPSAFPENEENGPVGTPTPVPPPTPTPEWQTPGGFKMESGFEIRTKLLD